MPDQPRSVQPDDTQAPAAEPSGFSVSVLTALGLGLLGFLLWEAVPPGVWHDDGAYLLLGRSIADGEGLRYAQVPGSLPGAKFPPLYPLVLAVLWKVAPAAVGQGSLASALNFFFVAAAGGVFVAFLRSLKFSWQGAVATTTVLWLVPDVWRLALVPLSEPLFLLALVVALWMGARLEEGPSAGRLAAFLVSLAIAYHVRTMGLVVGAAVPLALLLRGRTAWAVKTAAGGALVMGPWLMWSGRAAEAIPVPLRDTLGPYGGWLSSQASADGAGFLAGMVGRAVALAGRIGDFVVPGVEGFAEVPVVLVVAGLAGLGAYRLSRRSWTPVLTAALLTALLWIWPFQERRLILPLMPIAGLILVSGFGAEVRALGRRVLRRESTLGLGTTALAVLGLVWALWLGAAGARDLAARGHVHAFDLRVQMLARAVEAVEERVPEDGVVGAPELWAGLALHTGRPVSPSARFRLVGEGPTWGTPQEQFELWTTAGIEYVVLESAGRIHEEALDELDARCPGSVQLLASWGGGLLVALAWDETCRTRVSAGS